MHLHSHFTNAKIKGNLFVKSPDCYAMENVSLAFRQRLKTFNVTFHSANLPTSGGIGRNAHDYGVQKCLISNGLGQKILCSGLDRAHRGRDVPVACQEDDGGNDAELGETGLDLEPRRAGQADIEQDAGGIGSLADARELQRAAVAAEVIASVPFVYRFYPMVREARARVLDGELGRIGLIGGAYLQDWLLPQGSSDWRMDGERGGPSRAFADIGSHWCDLVEFAAGMRIAALSARRTAGSAAVVAAVVVASARTPRRGCANPTAARCRPCPPPACPHRAGHGTPGCGRR